MTTNTLPALPAQGRPRSVAMAYAICVAFGLLGAHRLYLGRSMSAAGMALITLASVPLIWSGLGLLGFTTTGTWALADLILIPAMARQLNEGSPAV